MTIKLDVYKGKLTAAKCFGCDFSRASRADSNIANMIKNLKRLKIWF